MEKIPFIKYEEISSELTPLELKLLVVELNDRLLKKLDENAMLITENKGLKRQTHLLEQHNRLFKTTNRNLINILNEKINYNNSTPEDFWHSRAVDLSIDNSALQAQNTIFRNNINKLTSKLEEYEPLLIVSEVEIDKKILTIKKEIQSEIDIFKTYAYISKEENKD
jgi:hypothetical protein